MPDATITSTASTFGTITGTFLADQSTITGTVTGVVVGTLDGSVGVPGIGVPDGGTTGQVLAKASDTSYDTVWIDNSAETLTATVRNETGATLSKATVVYITGAAGNKALVSKASASSEATSSKTFAILAEDIPHNQNGTAVCVGLLKSLDTIGLTEGGSLWLSTTAGQWTQTMPTAPNHAVFLGTVTRVHANQGTVEIRIQNGLELQELHNVKITSVSNGQVLKYDSSQSLWVNGTDISGVAWGGITGDITAQGDLNTALGLKYDASNPSGFIDAAYLTTNNYATQSWVTGQNYITPTLSDRSTKIATTEFVKNMIFHPGAKPNYDIYELQSVVSGAGAVFQAFPPYSIRMGGANASTAGSVLFRTNNSSMNSNNNAGLSRGTNNGDVNWSKPIWVTFRMFMDTVNTGDVFRFTVGKSTGSAVGNLANRGIGVTVTGQGFLVLQVHNGTTLTNVTSSYQTVLYTNFDVEIYSDGSGNVYLYVNNSQVASTASGPTTKVTSGGMIMVEMVSSGTQTTNSQTYIHTIKSFFGE